VYTIGNALIARTMHKYQTAVGLNVLVRLMTYLDGLDGMTHFV
jgi:hypothetical protein